MGPWTGFRGLLVLAIVLGLPLISYYAVFKPQNKAIEKEREQIKYQQDLLQKLKAESAKHADLQKANEEAQVMVKSIEAKLPTGKEIDGVVRQVSELAIQAGLQPPAMRSTKPVPAMLYMEQPLETEVTGDFVGFFSFLARLEKMPRIIRIPDLKISGQSGKEGVEVKAEFTLSIYFQDQNKVAEAMKSASAASGTTMGGK